MLDDAAGPFQVALAALASCLFPDCSGISQATRLSGGASQETWSFDILHGGARRPVILRRAPEAYRAPATAPSLALEARLMQLAAGVGVPSPPVIHVLAPQDQLGEGFLMEHVAGETIPRKILRDPRFADARARLAFELGSILARLHAIDTAACEGLAASSVGSTLADLHAAYEADGCPRPVFALAFRWLGERLPPDPPRQTLVHGDFRNGNLIVGPAGVAAVLDWELAHIGDPMEDLGWLCVNSWRFGEIDKPVGGFGPLEDLVAGYEAAGGIRVDPQRVLFWQALGTLRWGVICLGMLARYESGEDRSIERAMIGRRASEAEIDLLRIIAPRPRG